MSTSKGLLRSLRQKLNKYIIETEKLEMNEIKIDWNSMAKAYEEFNKIKSLGGNLTKADVPEYVKWLENGQIAKISIEIRNEKLIQIKEFNMNFFYFDLKKIDEKIKQTLEEKRKHNIELLNKLKEKSILLNAEKEEIINMLNNNYDYEKIKRIVGEKIDFLMFGKNNEVAKLYDEKINELLEIQEKLYVRNEIIKQKISFMDNYLNSLKTEN